MAKVKIEIEAADKASAVIKKTSNSLGDMVKKIDGGIKSLTGFSLAQVGVMTAINAATKAAVKAIGEYSDYVEQIDKMTMATGMSAVEMSRLSQVADDFRVDINGLQSALGMALKNGFNPTTENLAKLADELRGISDPTEKAEKLTKIFGRQWEVVIPLLDRGGDAIREASAGIQDGLIVTEQAIEANRKYQESVDNLADSWTAYRNTILKDVVPAIAEYLDDLNEVIQMQREGKTSLEISERMWRKHNATTYDWSDAQREAMKASQKLYEVVDKDLEPAIDTSAATMYEARQAAKAAADAYDEYWRNVNAAKQASEELTAAQLNLQGAQANFRQETGTDVAGELRQAYEAGTLSVEDYEAALGAIDEVSGTTLLRQKEMEDAQKLLVDEFLKSPKAIDDFKAALGNFDDTWSQFNEDIIAASKLVEQLQRQLDTLDGTYYINIEFQGGAAGAGGGIGAVESAYGIDLNGNGIIGARHGLDDFVVPPGYDETAGRPFLVAASSGERINVDPSGRGGGGNTYNLTIRTDRSQRVVERGFAIQRALAGV